MTTEAIGRRLRTLLAERDWTQSDLVRASGVDKNTLSGLMTGKTQPRPATLAKIESALGLTLGTLEALGEEPAWGSEGRPGSDSSADLGRIGNDELIGELSERLRALRRRVRELEPLAERELARERERQRFLAAVTEGSDPEHQWIAHQCERLAYMSEEESWGSEEARLAEYLDAKIDALLFQQAEEAQRDPVGGTTPLGDALAQLQDNTAVQDDPPAPRSLADHKRARLDRDALPADEAAYDGDDPEDPGE